MRAAVERFAQRWWRGEAGPLGRLADAVLFPAEAGYRSGVRLRNSLYRHGLIRVHQVPVPVVSVGNIGVGGAGKTPVSAWLAGRLRALGARPALVLRGYGMDEVQVHRELNPDVPVIVAPARVQGARQAADQGADVVVLDDGFQHRALARDLDVVLLSADAGMPARLRLLPRGPWREPIESLARADLVIVTSKAASVPEMEAVVGRVERLLPTVSTALCTLAPVGVRSPSQGRLPLDTLRGRQVLAMSALADPAAFERNLQTLGARVESLIFPDHHEYTREDAANAIRRAAGRPILVTHKDLVKMRALPELESYVCVLEQGVEFPRGLDTVEAALAGVLGRRA